LLGEYYELGGKQIEGLAIVDLKTVREPGERLIGNVMIDVEIDGATKRLAGFENHGGRTYLTGSGSPLGKVVEGFGNNGKDGFEGVRRDNVIGTYLHGPLLPKNAWFADYLTKLALSRDRPVELEPLDDELEDLAHESALRAAHRSHGFGAKLRGRR
jgi:CobQ-like glutamine amidotransferase family enzyme